MSREYLYTLNRRKAEIRLQHTAQRENLQNLLQDYVSRAKLQSSVQSVSNVTELQQPKEQPVQESPVLSGTSDQDAPYFSRWLPGPLSYPWMFILASIPQIVKQIFNLS